MKTLALILSIIVLILAGTFGYFLSQNNWDVTMTRHVMSYELDKLMGKSKDGIDDLSDKVDAKASEITGKEEEQEEQAEQPVAPVDSNAHSKDSLYKDNEGGTPVFSDVKKSGTSSNYQPKP